MNQKSIPKNKDPRSKIQDLAGLARHPLIYGSSIVVIGGLVANFVHFLFNLFLSRNLSIADYGTFASIISFITFPGLIASAITPLVVRFAGEYFAKEDLAHVRGLYLKIFKFIFFTGLVCFVLFLIFIPSMSAFFQIDNKTIFVLADFMIFLGFLNIINIALLQAKLAFGYQVLLSLFGAIIKLILGITFVFIGFSVTGAIGAVLIASILSYIASFFPFRFIFDKKLIANSVINTKELYAYGIPSALTLIGLTSIISADVILVKHFFPGSVAGLYAGMSLIGRVIFYISAPIASVMFPIVVKKYNKNENFNNIFLLSLFLVSVPSILITTFYYMFPQFTILFFLKKAEYLSLMPYLGFFGIFLSLYSLLFIISNFYLSIKKTKVYFPIIIGGVIQILLITFFHQTFLQIIQISVMVTFLLVVSLLLYYPHATQKRL